jgi:hypothetical protein
MSEENIEGINNISLEDLKIKENEEKNLINLIVSLLNKIFEVYNFSNNYNKRKKYY